MLEKLLDLPRAASASSLFEDGCATIPSTLQPYQQAQVTLPTGVGRRRPDAWRVSASVGTLMAMAPEVLNDLSGAIGEKVRTEPAD